MTQPSVNLRVAEPEFVIQWLRKMFIRLRLLKSKGSKITVELIRPEAGDAYIKVTRRG